MLGILLVMTVEEKMNNTMSSLDLSSKSNNEVTIVAIRNPKILNKYTPLAFLLVSLFQENGVLKV